MLDEVYNIILAKRQIYAVKSAIEERRRELIRSPKNDAIKYLKT